MKSVESLSLSKQFSIKNLRSSKQQTDSQGNFSDKPRLIRDEYSFNQDHSDSSKSKSNIYLPCSEQYQTNSISNQDLLRKYNSIYQQLKDVDSEQIMQLFLEELEEHQKSRRKLMALERTIKFQEEEIVQLKELLNHKRQSIAQLCQTQSNHLNMIEQLQGQIKNKCFSAENHFQKKYKQLQNYMNEYIASNTEVQEQICRNFKLIKNENNKLLMINQQIRVQFEEQKRKINIYQSKIDKLQKMIATTKQKEVTFAISIDNLQEQCNSLRRQNQTLKENLKQTEQFQVQLTKENRELSSQLDFIKQKINQNQNISKDIIQKIQEQNQTTIRMSQELQKALREKEDLIEKTSRMMEVLEQTNREKELEMKNKQAIVEHYNKLTQQLESSKTQVNQTINLNQNLKCHIERLQKDMAALIEQHQQLMQIYEHQKQSKQMIKAQLLQLANQVRFMEQTYKKELTQNQKIKQQIQKFWLQRQQQPLIERSQNCSQTSFSQNQNANHIKVNKKMSRDNSFYRQRNQIDK